MQDLVRYISHDLHTHIKSWFLIVSIYFNCNYFIGNYQPSNFLLFYLICESPQEYSFNISSEVSMELK